MKKRLNRKDKEKLFWQKVDKKGPYDCWEWNASKFENGYGQFSTYEGNVRAHRFAWEIDSRHKIPEGMKILHLCDNPGCCNPMHLFCGTQKDNIQDASSKGRLKKDLNVRQNIALKRAELSAYKIIVIRKLKIIISENPKKYKYTQETVAKVFKVGTTTVGRIWNSDIYPCKEGYYVNLKEEL